MTKKQKKTLKRIIISAVLYLAIILASKLVAIPWYLELVLFLVPYFIIGHDVLRKAVLGIVHGEVFDENFLMAVATVGALCLGEFSESVAVMLFYQIGELFQSYAVGKSRKSISDLMDIRPDSANLETDDGTVSTVDPDDVPIGSVLVEQAADAAEAELRQWAAEQDKYLTGRFSPGYGDWPIGVQPLVAAALDTARRAGLCVTENDLMTPRKSVTALLGLSDHPVKGRLAGCGHCVLNTRCEYRKRGITCASE